MTSTWPQTVVITGASAGVGRATARRFARQATAIALIARGDAKLEAAAAEVEELGARALPIALDVADAHAVRSAAERIERELGPIDVWINNAMVTVFGPVSELEPEELVRVTEVTYLGAVWGTLAALACMKPRDRGVIVQVGSALAYRAIPLQAPYCAAKHALRAFTDSVRCELIHEGSKVHITSVHLPALNTPQFTWGRSRMSRQAQPVPPIYSPEVAADGIHQAAHRRRRELYVGWATVKAVLGQRIIPGLLDHYLAKAAWDGQLADKPPQAPEQDNLLEPVSEDHGAHGMFVQRERSSSLFDGAMLRLGAAGVQTLAIFTTLIATAAVTAGVLSLLP